MNEKKLDTLLAETHEEHIKSALLTPIAAGDLANEAGKSYMRALNESIDRHRKFKRHKLYFRVIIKKNSFNDRVINITTGVTEDWSGVLDADSDLWIYDYDKEELRLLYSLPNRLEMKNFLRDPDTYSKEFIQYIRTYLKQEGIEENDL